MFHRQPFPTLSAVAVLVAAAAAAPQDLIVRGGRPHAGEPLAACDVGRSRCEFSDSRQTNTYVVTGTSLARASEGREVYRITIAGGVVRAKLAAMNRDRTQLAILLVQESMAAGALFSPGMIAPDSLHRQYTISIRNPKTGDEIKAVDLGMLKPSALGLTPTGEHMWVAGEELQLRRQEVRAYNTRSGKLEHMTPFPKGTAARLFEDGFDVGTASYVVENTASSGTGPRKHLSANPYSIAEFSVRVVAPLAMKTFGGDPIAVVAFEGAEGEVRELLESALAVKLAGAGLKMVERKRIKELLQEAQFQNLGITESKTASELGRMANAKYLVFGTLRATGSTTLMALRLVGVEDGTQHAAVELECRDCTPDDYLQGLGFLAADWIVANR
jgi:TolB-like protein